MSGLTKEVGLSTERCMFVPGDDDVCDLCEASIVGDGVADDTNVAVGVGRARRAAVRSRLGVV